MKKNKSELLFEAWIALLNYLDRHRIQGRIAIFFIGLIGTIFAIHYCVQDFVLIIEAFKQ